MNIFAAIDPRVIAIGAIIALIVLLIVIGIFAWFFRLWIQGVMTNAKVGIGDLIGMTFRKVKPAVIVRCKIMAVQAGLTDEMGITTRALEAHYLAEIGRASCRERV